MDKERQNGLNSIGSLASDETDLERIFTSEGKCPGCSHPIKMDAETDGVKLAHCTNEACGRTFTNVVVTGKDAKLIKELVSFKPIMYA